MITLLEKVFPDISRKMKNTAVTVILKKKPSQNRIWKGSIKAQDLKYVF